MKAVILCGGNGANLRPITHAIPKALIPMFGRTLLDHVIDIYLSNEVYEWWLSVCLHNKGGYILDKYKYPFFAEGVPMGSGGWLLSLQLMKDPLFDYFKKEDFYVSNVDNLAVLDLKNLLKKHKENKAVVTIACTKVDDVSEYGAVHIKDEKILSFQEKDKTRIKQSGWVNAGFYIFSPEIFNYLPNEWEGPYSLEKDLFPELAKKGVLFAYQEEFDWSDTSSMKSYGEILTKKKGLPKPNENG